MHVGGSSATQYGGWQVCSMHDALCTSLMSKVTRAQIHRFLYQALLPIMALILLSKLRLSDAPCALGIPLVVCSGSLLGYNSVWSDRLLSMPCCVHLWCLCGWVSPPKEHSSLLFSDYVISTAKPTSGGYFPIYRASQLFSIELRSSQRIITFHFPK